MCWSGRQAGRQAASLETEHKQHHYREHKTCNQNCIRYIIFLLLLAHCGYKKIVDFLGFDKEKEKFM